MIRGAHVTNFDHRVINSKSDKTRGIFKYLPILLL